MFNMLTRFDAIMAYTLDAGARSTTELPWPDLTVELLQLVDEERRLAPPASCTDADLDACRFAVYAWVDETLLSSKRTDALLWMSGSLQQRFFQTSNAGMEFYDRLHELLTRPEEGGLSLPSLSLPSPSWADEAIGTPENSRGQADQPESLAARLASWKPMLASSVARTAQGTSASWDNACHNGRGDVIRVYAACLLYGFRGALGRPECEATRRELLPICADLVAPADIWPLQRRELADTQHHATSTQIWKTLFVRLEPFMHIVVPALICLGFYVYCADIVAAITMPALNS